MTIPSKVFAVAVEKTTATTVTESFESGDGIRAWFGTPQEEAQMFIVSATAMSDALDAVALKIGADRRILRIEEKTDLTVLVGR